MQKAIEEATFLFAKDNDILIDSKEIVNLQFN
jgi:hypothetical protein